ncbi:MAG: ribosome-associated translation inhibitor RaiA [Actinomycetia bacterium]|nr:ribosome-associated translation inhibitor RaiA [Actinomycetes bacterium]
MDVVDPVVGEGALTRAEPRSEIVVRGRNVDVPDHFRSLVEQRLARLERYDGKIIRTDVELNYERNPRQNETAARVEVTCHTRGPVVRSEASAADFYRALELAADKLERRLRQAAGRRRARRTRRAPMPATAPLVEVSTDGRLFAEPDRPPEPAVADAAAELNSHAEHDPDEPDEPDEGEQGPGRIVRVKEHPGTPMTVDEALFEMELVGHDFYLFADSETGRPSVVYRRHAYDYGLLRMGD